MRPTPVASGPDDLSVLEIGRTAIGTVHVDAAQVSHILLITNLFFFIQYSHQYLWGPIFFANVLRFFAFTFQEFCHFVTCDSLNDQILQSYGTRT